MTTTQQAASKYLEHGYSPIPLVSGQKRPLLKDWTKYKETPIEDLNLFTTDSLGLVCGYNGLEVLDIDAKHFTGNEFEEYIELLEANGPGLLAKMVIQQTPSGGFHFLYRCEVIEGNQKLAKNEAKEVTYETRGIGGQVAAWPTPGYKLETKASAIQWITPEERDILLDCARELDKTPKVEIRYEAPKQALANNEELTPWADYNEKIDCLTLLQSYGWTIVREDSKYVYVKRPGTTDARDSGKIFKDTGKLWVWSTSTASTDMSAAFIKGVTENLTEAEITFDRFHVMKLIGHAIDEVRRDEVKAQPELKGTRYLWTKNAVNLTARQSTVLDALSSTNLKTARAWRMRLAFQEIYDQPTRGWAEIFFDKWIGWAKRSRLDAMKAVARTMEKHRDGILAWFDSGISNGLIEGINSLVQAAKAKARGYRNSKTLKAVTYLIAGKLDLRLPT